MVVEDKEAFQFCSAVTSCRFVFFRANIDEVETEVVEIEAKLDKVRCFTAEEWNKALRSSDCIIKHRFSSEHSSSACAMDVFLHAESLIKGSMIGQ